MTRRRCVGLAAYETLAEAAARVTVPVEFLLQSDDELVPRDSGLALRSSRLGCTPRHARPPPPRCT
jgi:hypothetical protein